MTTSNTLLGALAPKGEAAKLATNIVTVLLGTLLLTLSAKISVPVWPVPVTMQTFAVAALAAAFGWRIGVATVLAYLVEGASGLPVFASGGGLAYFAGPTTGFLLGYLPMAYIIGRATDLGASNRPFTLFGAMLLGDAVLFVCGFVWLMAMAGHASWIDQANVVGSAFAKAVQPFIIWDILKMGLAALTVTGAWALLKPKR
ncbi:biotin transporter BioY [Devosia sp.]|uniref:biotin transporter BioY n=1 Tax=Devosia sp. TaxID=1871048 RepID=UPI003265BEF9